MSLSDLLFWATNDDAPPKLGIICVHGHDRNDCVNCILIAGIIVEDS